MVDLAFFPATLLKIELLHRCFKLFCQLLGTLIWRQSFEWLLVIQSVKNNSFSLLQMETYVLFLKLGPPVEKCRLWYNSQTIITLIISFDNARQRFLWKTKLAEYDLKDFSQERCPPNIYLLKAYNRNTRKRVKYVQS